MTKEFHKSSKVVGVCLLYILVVAVGSYWGDPKVREFIYFMLILFGIAGYFDIADKFEKIIGLLVKTDDILLPDTYSQYKRKEKEGSMFEMLFQINETFLLQCFAKNGLLRSVNPHEI